MKRFSLRLKRGMSLVEIVVSIFIITLMSATAITLISTSIKSDQKNLRDTEIALATKSVIDCFNFANDFEEFYDVLCTLDDDYTKDEQGEISLSKKRFILVVTADFVQNEITVEAFDKAGNSLSTTSYNKG